MVELKWLDIYYSKIAIRSETIQTNKKLGQGPQEKAQNAVFFPAMCDMWAAEYCMSLKKSRDAWIVQGTARA